MNSDYAIKIENLRKSIGGFQLQVDGIQIPKGTVMGLIGENGAGKTTLIKCLLDIWKFSGKIEFFGENASAKTKQKVGFIVKDASMSEYFTPIEIGKILKGIYRDFDFNLYLNFLLKFKVPKNKQIRQMSTGMKVKSKIAAVLSQGAEILILDEPTAGLDPIIRDEIIDILYDFMQDENHSILISSHITSDIEKLADYLTLIDGGKILWMRSMEDLRENYAIIVTDEKTREKIPDEFIESERKNRFNVKLLIKNREEFSKKFPQLKLERSSIEEFMLFYLRRD